MSDLFDGASIKYRRKYSSLRVLRKETIFINNFPADYNDSQKLSMFNRLGQVRKIITKSNVRNQVLYITFSCQTEAALALLVCSTLPQLDLKILFGTVQYCKYFLRKIQCKNSQCSYLHVKDSKNEITVDNQIRNATYFQHQALAEQLLQSHWAEQSKECIKRKQTHLSIQDHLSNIIQNSIEQLFRQHLTFNPSFKEGVPPLKDEFPSSKEGIVPPLDEGVASPLDEGEIQIMRLIRKILNTPRSQVIDSPQKEEDCALLRHIIHISK